MKTSAIVCAVLAGTLGFGSVAQAQDRHGPGGHDRGHRVEQRHDRHDRHDNRWDGRRDHDRRQPQARWHQPRPVYQPPRYVVQQPRYYQPHHGHRFYRGGYLPHQYRSNVYYVNNWQAYPGLYAPPYGQQWVNVDGQFLLVALATGLIANALLN